MATINTLESKLASQSRRIANKIDKEIHQYALVLVRQGIETTLANVVACLFVKYCIDLKTGTESYALVKGVEDYLKTLPVRFITNPEQQFCNEWLMPDNSVFGFSPERGACCSVSEPQFLWVCPTPVLQQSDD